MNDNDISRQQLAFDARPKNVGAAVGIGWQRTEQIRQQDQLAGAQQAISGGAAERSPMARLCASVNTLGEILEALAQRLGPILQAASPETKAQGGCISSQYSPINQCVLQQAYVVEAMGAKVADQLDRLDTIL